MVLLSDVDDSIKSTRLNPRGAYFDLVRRVADMEGYLGGMPELYRVVDQMGTKVEYVSSTPTAISGLARRFLKRSRFPEGPLWSRMNPTQDAAEYKYRMIRERMLAQPGKRFVLIGDNGEKDMHVLKMVFDDPELRPRLHRGYIHHLYDHPVLEGMPHGIFREYVTSAELALGFADDGLVTRAQANEIVELVGKGLRGPQAEKFLPSFFEVRPEELRPYFEVSGTPSPATEQVIQSIEKRLRETNVPTLCYRKRSRILRWLFQSK